MHRDLAPPAVGDCVQLVPPGGGGVHDFAAALQARWATGGLASQLVAWPGSAEALVDMLAPRPDGEGRPVALLLHYSGYGYHPRGLCHELLRGVDAVRARRGGGLRLVSYFHELYAAGPPWRSAFWLGGLQRALARRLAQMSDAVATNTRHHARWLDACRPGGEPSVVAPVFSSLVPPASLTALAAREPALLVFGAASTRTRALAHWLRHAPALQDLGVRAVTEIGPGEPVLVSRTVPVSALGRVPAAELSSALARHRWMLIDYPDIHLAKSSVFAAAAAHGCLVINGARSRAGADGLRPGREYLPLPPAGGRWPDAVMQQSVADAALRWSRGHDLPAQALRLAALMQG